MFRRVFPLLLHLGLKQRLLSMLSRRLITALSIGKVVSISPTTSNPDQQGTSPAYIARIGIQREALPENLPPDSLRSGMVSMPELCSKKSVP